MKDRHLLVDVALGRISADKVVLNGEFLDVATGRIRKGVNIAIKGERVAKIGDVEDTIGPETEVIDATGMTVTPGFVDSHYHIESSRLSPRRHAQLTLPYGTTSLRGMLLLSRRRLMPSWRLVSVQPTSQGTVNKP